MVKYARNPALPAVVVSALLDPARNFFCWSCGESKDSAKFPPQARTKRYCEDCVAAGKVPQLAEEANESRSSTYRKALYKVYGSGGKARCVCCGEKNELFLTIDHKNDDGAKWRANGITSPVAIYEFLKLAGFPPVIQILCFNCNCGRQRNKGVCPHKTKTPGG